MICTRSNPSANPSANPTGATPRRLRAVWRAVWRAGLLCAGMLALAGCKRTDEAEMRDTLGGWVPLGKTVSFKAAMGCAAGLFEVVSPRVASRMRVAGSVGEAAIILRSHDQVAIIAPRLTPDVALLRLIEADRPTGMRMRMAGLEGRACMDDAAEAAFAAAVVNRATVLLMDRETGILALLDPQKRLLVAVMGTE